MNNKLYGHHILYIHDSLVLRLSDIHKFLCDYNNVNLSHHKYFLLVDRNVMELCFDCPCKGTLNATYFISNTKHSLTVYKHFKELGLCLREIGNGQTDRYIDQFNS